MAKKKVEVVVRSSPSPAEPYAFHSSQMVSLQEFDRIFGEGPVKKSLMAAKIINAVLSKEEFQ